MRANIISKITNAPFDTYVIFFTPNCIYSIKALELLRSAKVPYKAYDINDLPGGLYRLIFIFNCHSNDIRFDSNHTTKPLIFYNHQFIGGYNQLIKFINLMK